LRADGECAKHFFSEQRRLGYDEHKPVPDREHFVIFAAGDGGGDARANTRGRRFARRPAGIARPVAVPVGEDAELRRGTGGRHGLRSRKQVRDSERFWQEGVDPAARVSKLPHAGVHVRRHLFCSHLAMRRSSGYSGSVSRTR
jgi:hypothetical protein